MVSEMPCGVKNICGHQFSRMWKKTKSSRMCKFVNNDFVNTIRCLPKIKCTPVNN